MLSTSEVSFLRGVVSDTSFPYYVVYQEPERLNGYTYRTIHVFLSEKPFEFNSRAFSSDSSIIHYSLVNDQVFSLISSNEIPGTIPSDALCYTNTENTPGFADLYDSTIIQRDVPFNIPLVVTVVFAASLVAGIVRSVLFGGKS